MALFLSALGVLPLLFASLWLPWLHAPSEVEAHVACYLRVLALALPGALMFRAIYAVNTAMSRPHVFFDTLQTVAVDRARAGRAAPGRVLPRTPAVPLVSGAAYDCSGRHRPARPR